MAANERPEPGGDASNQDVDVLIAKNVRRWRERLGLSQQQVMEHMIASGYDWNRNTVSSIELQRRKVTVAEVVSLAELFHLSIEELLSARADDELQADVRELVKRMHDVRALAESVLAHYVRIKDKYGDDDETLAFVPPAYAQGQSLSVTPAVIVDSLGGLTTPFKELIFSLQNNYLAGPSRVAVDYARVPPEQDPTIPF